MKRSLPVFLSVFLLFFGCYSSTAQHTQFQTGDIFLGQGLGIIQWRDSNGGLIKNINTGDASVNGNGTGLRIHPITGELWATNDNGGLNNTKGIRIIHKDGSIGDSINIFQYQKNPTSITFDRQGNAYVGGLWSEGDLVKINPAGTAILDHYHLSTDGYIYGPEWVEMDCNDSIIYYASLRAKVKRYNVVTHQQLSDFTDLTSLPNNWFFAMRFLPDSTTLVVAADNQILRLNSAGAIIQHYAPANLCGFFGISGTPDGKSFWAGGGAFYGPMYKFDIATGNVLDSFLALPTQAYDIYGIAIVGDALNNCKPTPPPIGALFEINNAYPNPSNGNFTIPTSLTGKLTVKIYNKLGQPVFMKEFNFTGTHNKIPINMWKPAAGIYLVQVISKDERSSQKIMIW